MSWESVKLEDISSGIQTGPFGSQLHQSDYTEDGTPVVMPKDLIGGKISEQSIARVGAEHVQRLQRHIIQNGDILYSRRGDVGRCAFATERETGWLCGTGCLRVTVNPRVADKKFVFYQLQQSSTIDWVEKHAVGATMLNLNTKILSNIPVFLPPIETQHRIADILSAYDDLIENNRKQIKLLEEAAQRLYKEWFVDLRFPGYEHTKIVDGVPAGWEKKPLSSIADVVMGQSPKSEFYNQIGEGLPFHQGVGSYGNRFVKDETYSTSFTRVAEAGSVLFSVRAPVGRLNITKNKIVIGRGIAALNHKNRFQSFLFYMLKERFFKDNLVGNGSIFASISKDELLNQQFIIPCEDILVHYDRVAKNIDERIAVLDRQIELLTQGRDRLLPKLMSEEVEVW